MVPSPKSHDHPVGDPVEVSVNFTSSGAVPVVGVAVKSATGEGAGSPATSTVRVTVAEPPAFVTVRLTV